jgi:para-nitrobenzyl esterase
MDEITHKVATDVVQTEYGPVAGESGAVRVFRGIPFAQSTAGELRWKPPVPPKPWREVRDATQWGYDPPQSYNAQYRSPGWSEDCLNLNIWTPAQDDKANLPVLVWIYGGSFLRGSGADPRSDGTLLARKGAVVVTLNYRLGLMGHLGHPALTAESPHKSSSNYSLLDCIAALRWIKANIKSFGGDPNAITPFGCSAGSAAIGLLLVSPLAEGLFDRAILESPGAFRPLASLADSEKAGLQLGPDLKTIRALTADEVLKRHGDFIPKMRGLTTPRVLRPIRDGWVIPQDEADAFAAGNFHKMPILVGTQVDEGGFFLSGLPVKTLEDYQAVIAENFGARAKEAAEHYGARSEAEIPVKLAQLFGEAQFQYGARRLAREMGRAHPKTFRYLFNKWRAGANRMPTHSEEVNYVFGEPVTCSDGTYDATDAKVSETMMETWVRFAKTGDPNGPGVPQWPAYDEKSDSYMEFGDTPKVASGFRRDALDFLDRYFGAK